MAYLPPRLTHNFQEQKQVLNSCIKGSCNDGLLQQITYKTRNHLMRTNSSNVYKIKEISSNNLCCTSCDHTSVQCRHFMMTSQYFLLTDVSVLVLIFTTKNILASSSVACF